MSKRDLRYTITQLVFHKKKEGSGTTKSNRSYRLQAFVAAITRPTLEAPNGRYSSLRNISQIKQKHIKYAWEYWTKEKNLKPETLHSYLTAIRWLQDKIHKPGMVEALKLDIPKREYAVERGREKNWTKILKKLNMTKEEIINGVKKDNIKLCLKLEDAFGLRAEEAMKFQPKESIYEDKIHLYHTKNGRERDVPITNQKQRDVLDEVKTFLKKEKSKNLFTKKFSSYKTFRKHYYNEMDKYGIKKDALGITSHALRTEWANNRYDEIKNDYKNERNISKWTFSDEKNVRRILAEELGHSRWNITYKYVGK